MRSNPNKKGEGSNDILTKSIHTFGCSGDLLTNNGLLIRSTDGCLHVEIETKHLDIIGILFHRCFRYCDNSQINMRTFISGNNKVNEWKMLPVPFVYGTHYVFTVQMLCLHTYTNRRFVFQIAIAICQYELTFLKLYLEISNQCRTSVNCFLLNAFALWHNKWIDFIFYAPFHPFTHSTSG